MCHVPNGGGKYPPLVHELHDHEGMLEASDKPSRFKHKPLNATDKSPQKLGKKLPLYQEEKIHSNYNMEMPTLYSMMANMASLKQVHI